MISFVQQLESDLRIYEGILIDAHSPYHFNLTSTFVISLPAAVCTVQDEHQCKETIARAFSLFEWKIETSGDISDW